MTNPRNNCVRAILWTFAIMAIPLPAQETKRPDPKPIKTTLCEVVGHPEKFQNRKVEFFAHYQSDGLEHSALFDPKCGRGIRPFYSEEAEHQADIEAFDRALDKGQPGTLDKRVTGIFIGKFICKPSCPSPGRLILEIERVDGLEVTMIDTKPHIPKKQ